MNRHTLRLTHAFGRGIAENLGIKYYGITYSGKLGKSSFIFLDRKINRKITGISIATTRHALEKARAEGVKDEYPKDTIKMYSPASCESV